MAKLTQVVNVLSTWNYISVVRIKTKPDNGLKIVVKRTADFQKHFDDFAQVLQQRREERDRLKAEQKAAAEQQEGDTEASAEASSAAQPEAPAAESSSAPAEEAVQSAE